MDGDWVVQTISDSSSPNVRIGRQSSLAFGADGRAHVAYYVGRQFRGTFLRHAVSTPITATSTPAPTLTQTPSRWTTARPRLGVP